jgi:hypothetical protein
MDATITAPRWAHKSEPRCHTHIERDQLDSCGEEQGSQQIHTKPLHTNKFYTDIYLPCKSAMIFTLPLCLELEFLSANIDQASKCVLRGCNPHIVLAYVIPAASLRCEVLRAESLSADIVLSDTVGNHIVRMTVVRGMAYYTLEFKDFNGTVTLLGKDLSWSVLRNAGEKSPCVLRALLSIGGSYVVCPALCVGDIRYRLMLLARLATLPRMLVRRLSGRVPRRPRIRRSSDSKDSQEC